MILFAEQTFAPEHLAQLAMAGDSVAVSPALLQASVPPQQQAPETVAPVEIMPTPWLAIDIETAHGRPEDVERHIRLHWSPPSNVVTAAADESRSKEDRDKSLLAIGRAHLRIAEARQEKSAILDASPIVVISIRTPNNLHALHCLRAEAAATHTPTGGVTQGFGTGKEMLVALRAGLDAICTPETLLVGHNIQSFDLPRLRWAYLRAGLRMPWVLAHDAQPCFDIMRQFGRRFSQVDRPFIALADVLEEFGIHNHKTDLDGSRVPEMVKDILAGKWELLPELMGYALQDANTEATVFLRMTNQLPDQPTAQEAQGA